MPLWAYKSLASQYIVLNRYDFKTPLTGCKGEGYNLAENEPFVTGEQYWVGRWEI
jgi:hypothetical protein